MSNADDHLFVNTAKDGRSPVEKLIHVDRLESTSAYELNDDSQFCKGETVPTRNNVYGKEEKIFSAVSQHMPTAISFKIMNTESAFHDGATGNLIQDLQETS